MKKIRAVLLKTLLVLLVGAPGAMLYAQDSTCTRNNVGNSLMESLDYLAANHLLGGTVAGTTPNLIPNGDFEKDLSGLILQSTSQPADYQCLCSGPSPHCDPNAQCDATGTTTLISGDGAYYHTTNFTDMMGYLEFNTQLKYQYAWSASIATGYFAVKNVHQVNSVYADHTSQAYGYGGQGLMVDGPNGTVGQYKQAWSKTFTLLPNRTYKFTYWFLGFPLSGGTAAKFSFGTPKGDGTFQDMQNLQLDGASFTPGWPYVPSNNNWHSLSGTVTTTTSNIVTIAVYTYYGSDTLSNNDCVFDDMSMVEKDTCASGATWTEVFPDHVQIALSVPTLTGGCTQCNVNLMRKPGDVYYDFSKIIHITNLRPDPNYPGSRNAFLVDIETADPSRPGAAHIHTIMSGYYDCDYLFDCPPKNCCVVKGDIVNPYVQGLRGNWKANKAYLYNATRLYDPTPATRTNPNQGVYVRQSGVYDQFSEFWHYDGTNWQSSGASSANWSWKAEVTMMNPYGADVENRDPLYRYSAAVYGYNYSAAIAVGNNTRYRQMAYDGFEDYDFFDPTCETRHFNIENPPLTTVHAHTGLKSLLVTSGHKVGIDRQITSTPTSDPTPVDSRPYTVADHDLLGIFTPDDNNDYVLSFWVYEELPSESSGKPSLDGSYFNYLDPRVTILLDGAATTLLSEQHGPMVDRWQQIIYTFHIPSGKHTMQLQYLGEMRGKGLKTYYDDVRIYPLRATMKSYVYNPVTLKLMAELDENNYATFYEYDLEGKLSRVKKETEKGIYSIQESRTSMPKQ